MFFFQAEDGIRDVAVTGVQTCALPISGGAEGMYIASPFVLQSGTSHDAQLFQAAMKKWAAPGTLVDSISDRKSTRLNSSHGYISYAVFCLKKKNQQCTLVYSYFETVQS